MNNICSLLSKIINSELFIAIILSGIAIIASIITYFRQKEYELVQKRYLTDCIDLICKDIDYSLGIFRNNWSKSLQMVKQFRDADLAMNKEDYQLDYLVFDHTKTKIEPFFRLKRLLDDNVFYEYTQLIWGFVENTYSFFERDFRKAISLFVESSDKNVNVKNKLIKTYQEQIIAFERESHKYYSILLSLMKISSIFEMENFSFKKVNTFKNRDDIKEILNELKSYFKEISSSNNND